MMGDSFEMITAFSREGQKKVYVQHRLKEQAKLVNELLEKKAYIYVCGDAANMAREVNTVLAQIIAEQRGIPETKAEEIVKNMRAANQYQVCRVPLLVMSGMDHFTNSKPRRTYGHRSRSRAEPEGRLALELVCMGMVLVGVMHLELDHSPGIHCEQESLLFDIEPGGPSYIDYNFGRF